MVNPEWRKRRYNKPDLTATDYSPETLAAAAHNWRLLNPEWHDAASCDATDGEICYYRDSESGSHGWMCTKCYGIVQTPLCDFKKDIDPMALNTATPK